MYDVCVCVCVYTHRSLCELEMCTWKGKHVHLLHLTQGGCWVEPSIQGGSVGGTSLSHCAVSIAARPSSCCFISWAGFLVYSSSWHPDHMQFFKSNFRFFIKIKGRWPTPPWQWYSPFLWEALLLSSSLPCLALLQRWGHCPATTALLGADCCLSVVLGWPPTSAVVPKRFRCGCGDAVTPQAGCAAGGARTKFWGREIFHPPHLVIPIQELPFLKSRGLAWANLRQCRVALFWGKDNV